MTIESDNNATIRHARSAVDLIIDGAMRQIESRYATTESPECRTACNSAIEHAIEELQSWMIVDPSTGEPTG
jgi:hypothetical protein